MGNYIVVFGVFVLGIAMLFAMSCQTGTVKVNNDDSVNLEHSSVVFPIYLTNSDGTQTILEEFPERIVVFDAAAVEILFAIGEEDRIVGTHEFVVYPREVDGIAKVGDAFNMNFEAVLDKEPDLVYMFFSRFVPELKQLGLTVLYLDSLDTDINSVMEHFRLWGLVTGQSDLSNREIGEFQERLNRVKQALVDIDEGPRVYHHTTDYWTPGEDTLIGSIYKLLKADLITNDISGYDQMNLEDIVERDPEVIVTPANSAEQIIGNRAIAKTTAVLNQRVVIYDEALLSIAGPRLIDGIEELARLLYPNKFSN
ncbi:hypothetical protein FIM04_04465 [SAR202 cluster bacterium AC-409-J13_OGT_754m]|nr:hypothetical protein [SAR202 cluster bacterium AC-409-J13_OGT_754m]